MDLTKNLGLKKPSHEKDAEIYDVNHNMDILDSTINNIQIDVKNLDYKVDNLDLGGDFELLPDSVTTDILADNSVTTPKIVDNAVTGAKISNTAIINRHLSANAVEGFNVLDMSIPAGKLGGDSVSTANIQNLAVTNGKIANTTITGAKISNNTITSAQILHVHQLSGDIIIGANTTPSPTIRNANTVIGSNNLLTGTGTSGTVFGMNNTLNRTSTVIGNNSSVTAVSDGSTSFSQNLIVGNSSLASGSNALVFGNNVQSSFTDSVAIGSGSTATTTDQIMLGNSSSTPFSHRPLSILSDARDKANVQPLKYNALEFVNALEPVNYQYDARSNYTTYREISDEDYEKLDDYSKQHLIKPLRVNKVKDVEVEYFANSLTHNKEVQLTPETQKNIFTCNKQLAKYLKKYKKYKTDKEVAEFIAENTVPSRTIYMLLVQNDVDGSKRDKRYHNGLLAQDVEKVAEEMGFDFAGVKDHQVNGGHDMYSLSYEEFIAPMIQCIKDLTQQVKVLQSQINGMQN